ncbi:MAG: tRNA (adenosine(37)-N6)-dimethylallyltransferase MiaA [Porphyromonas sp.]|nr:tRNA (adenosine(37)-N6)-dimethylallyltransferase MiaA [Porphyromonas sp.]
MNCICRPLLVVLVGPTGVGKSDWAIALAQRWGCEIISADSRQVYRQIPIGTAAPSALDLAAVPHHFIGTRDVWEPYSAADYESDVMELLPRLFSRNPIQILCGGSMMYVDAVCHGIDDLPPISSLVRNELWQRFEAKGVEPLAEELGRVDPCYLERIDRRNHKRIIHALEVYYSSGRPYTSFHTHTHRLRSFDCLKICLQTNREVLYDRINNRVDRMLELGLLEEAESMYSRRQLNALNTVGYKELFAYFDGLVSLPQAVDLIKRNSRRYARKQLTWWRHAPKVHAIDLEIGHEALIHRIESLVDQVSPYKYRLEDESV